MYTNIDYFVVLLIAVIWWLLIQGLVNKHPDVKANHILAVLAMRGDLNKTTVTKVGIKISQRFHPSPAPCTHLLWHWFCSMYILLPWADHYPDSGDWTGSGWSISWGQCSGGEKVQCSCSQETSRGKEPSLSADCAKPLLLVWTITSVCMYNTSSSYYIICDIISFNVNLDHSYACFSFLLSTFTS